MVDGRFGDNLAYWILWIAAGVQGFHMLEHTIQLHQFVLGVPNPGGILGGVVDFVWIHVVYNTLFFCGLVYAYFHWRRDSGTWNPPTRTNIRAFLVLLGFQGYHTTEHMVQAYQYYGLGIAHPPGMIGNLLPNIIAHFDINLVATVLLAILLVTVRPRKHAPPTS